VGQRPAAVPAADPHPSSDRKRPGHIRLPRRLVLGRLHLRAACPREGGPHRFPQFPRQLVSLIEAPFPPALPVERDRHAGVGAPEDLTALASQQRGQGPGQRASSVVLEGVDDGAQRALVEPGRTGTGDEWRGRLARRAPRRCRGRAVCRAGLSADETQGRREASHASPAGPADGAAERSIERCAACRAFRGQCDGGQAVERSLRVGPGFSPGSGRGECFSPGGGVLGGWFLVPGSLFLASRLEPLASSPLIRPSARAR
jgi:hypothetical protein